MLFLLSKPGSSHDVMTLSLERNYWNYNGFQLRTAIHLYFFVTKVNDLDKGLFFFFTS